MALLKSCGGTYSPLHVAIIMDGNGRWATARGLPRAMGHRKGAEAVRAAVTAAADLGISHLTLFGFSTENWKRPESEVSTLMGLLRLYLKNEINKLHENGVCFRVIGERGGLSSDIVQLIESGERLTRSNTRLTLSLALNYGGRQEIVHAVQRLVKDIQENILSSDDITEETLNARLFAADIPAPDLIIRTSGEQRISNFLLWQAAYAEFLFIDTLWPDFSRTDLEEALSLFRKRERRFGAIGS